MSSSKKVMIPLLLLAVGYVIGISSEFKIIAAGIAIFLIGMYFMEDGFKTFAGGTLQHVLQKTTGTLTRAFFSGFIATSIVQSSSLITVIIISFLSADLIALTEAIGIVFGANLGTTTTAWIIAGFGVKIKIAYYAMPMLIFGIILRSIASKSLQGIGFVLLGLGFIFLGIGYMTEGFDTLKDAIDLSKLGIPGFLGVLVYLLVGIVATVILQSSSAALAITITALAAGQIDYISAISLAIGSNVGTTITAILGSLASNLNGKRLALAHLIFNTVTAVMALSFLHPLIESVDYLSTVVGIPHDNAMLKLSLFHTIFNLIGVVVLLPLTPRLVAFIIKIMPEKKSIRGEPLYLNETVLQTNDSALAALKNETQHLYDVMNEGVIHAFSLHWHDVFSDQQLHHIVNKKIEDIDIDVEHFYQVRAKNLYGIILDYATKATDNMTIEEVHRVYELKLASREMIRILKQAKEMHKNILFYHQHANKEIAYEYNQIRLHIATIIRDIDSVRRSEEDINVLTHVTMLSDEAEHLDVMKSGKIDALIRGKSIDTKMATSLMNDSNSAYQISKAYLEIARILWIKDQDIRAFELEEEGSK
jgi:phosphate:Na+ symporter